MLLRSRAEAEPAAVVTTGSGALVTGGAGFIGSHLVDRLVDEGWDVLVVDDLSRGHLDRLTDARQRGRVRFHQFDIRSEALAVVAERFQPFVVFHLAAQPSVPVSFAEPRVDADINVLGTINVAQAALASGAERIVYAGSGTSLYGERATVPSKEAHVHRPNSPYGLSKMVAGEYLRLFNQAYGLDHVLLELANVYGPRQRPDGESGVVAAFLSAMTSGGETVIHGNGTQTRDFLYVDDAVDAFVRAAAAGGGRRLNIGTGVETSVLDLHGRLARLTGYRRHARFVQARPIDVARSALDSEAAHRHLGWEPWTELDDGLARTIGVGRRPTA